MKADWKPSWVSSVQPRKQRKYNYNAPLHIRAAFLRAHLSKELRTKYKKRSIRLRTGDKIKVMRGQFKGKTGKVERVDMRLSRVYVTGMEVMKKDGSKTLYPLPASHLLIQDLVLDDKLRRAALEEGGKQ